jgi:hypothetical protein
MRPTSIERPTGTYFVALAQHHARSRQLRGTGKRTRRTPRCSASSPTRGPGSRPGCSAHGVDGLSGARMGRHAYRAYRAGVAENWRRSEARRPTGRTYRCDSPPGGLRLVADADRGTGLRRVRRGDDAVRLHVPPRLRLRLRRLTDARRLCVPRWRLRGVVRPGRLELDEAGSRSRKTGWLRAALGLTVVSLSTAGVFPVGLARSGAGLGRLRPALDR